MRTRESVLGEDELLSAAEVAQLFKVTSRTVARWSSREPPVLRELRTPGGHRRYRKVEVMALLSTVNPQENGEA